MAFIEDRFPQDQAFESSFGAGWNTNIIELDSGSEERVQRWAAARHQFDLAHSVRSKAALTAVKRFYMAMNGAANGFRFKDWFDYTSNVDGTATPDDEDQDIGTGDGTKTQFQLVKHYSSGSKTTTRNIKKPVDGTVVCALDGTPEAGFTLDDTTGVVTFSAAPANTVVVTAGFEFDVPVRFEQSADELLAIDWRGFENLDLSIPLIELVDENPSPENFNYGGSATLTMQQETHVTLGTGRVLNLDTSVSANELVLPQAVDLAAGGPYFYLINTGTVPVNLYEEGNTLDDAIVDLSYQLTNGDTAEAVVGKNSSDVNVWYFLEYA